MATETSVCPNCGAPIQHQALFCANCGTKITAPISFSLQSQGTSFPPASMPQPPVSTAAYKAIIGVLLVIIILLGIGLYASSSGHLLQLGAYRYQLANPPSYQSTQPAPAATTPPPTETIIWNACGGSPSAGCTMTSAGWREGSVPDTFDYYVSFTSNVSVIVYFFTMGQFVQFSVCNGDVSCVSGSYDAIPATTSLQTMVFTLGEGCADYLAIYVAAGNGIMHPNVGVNSHSASVATGYCAQVGP